MNTSAVIRISVLALCLFHALILCASDFKKEQRWADQIVDSLIEGKVLWLVANGHKFLTLYTESAHKSPKGAVIILHGIGAHPNWNEVVYPLRTRLPGLGWHSLSIQMPVLPNDAEYKQYASLFSEIAPRVNAAIKFLKTKKIKKTGLT